MRSTVSVPNALAYGEGESMPDNGEQAVLLAIANTVHAYPGGIAALAKRVGMSPNTLQHKANLNNETHHMTVADLYKIQRVTGDVSASQALVRCEGYVCILVNPTKPASVVDGIARLMVPVVELIESVRDATATGQPVTRQQNRRSEHHLAELIGAANALIALQRARSASPATDE